MARLYAATGDGIATLTERGGEWAVEWALLEPGVGSLAVDPADPDTVYAGLREGGVRRSTDAGRSWVDCNLPEAGVYSLAVSPADGAVYAGTEPSRLYRSDDRGERWRALDGLLAGLVLVGIELGGLMRSTDGGETWQDHRPGAQPDVHCLAWHPSVGGRAYEAGGRGAAWSEDGGATWNPADEGRDRHYTWAVAVDPDDPDRWYVSASTGAFKAHGEGDPQAQIYRREAGEAWQPVMDGLPDPLPAMPYALVTVDGRLVAGLRNGDVWQSADRGDSWEACALVGEPPAQVLALAAAGE
jgi:photosystem II stability/assembly factor-like uncharacterized protein